MLAMDVQDNNIQNCKNSLGSLSIYCETQKDKPRGFALPKWHIFPSHAMWIKVLILKTI